MVVFTHGGFEVELLSPVGDAVGAIVGKIEVCAEENEEKRVKIRL